MKNVLRHSIEEIETVHDLLKCLLYLLPIFLCYFLSPSVGRVCVSCTKCNFALWTIVCHY